MARSSLVCGAFVSPLQGDERGVGPFTQGGARQLRRLALPWANLFCPFGAWGFLNAARFLPGMAVPPDMAVPSEPDPRGAVVLTPRRGNDILAQGRASRRSRDALGYQTRDIVLS
jgi:hypothetical protein